MTDNTAAVDDVDQAPPIMRVVANADGTVTITMQPADAETLAETINDHLDRQAFGLSVRRIAHGVGDAPDLGSLRWTRLARDLRAARAELVDRVDVGLIMFGGAETPADFFAVIDGIQRRRPVDVDVTAATTPPAPSPFMATRTSTPCPGQCGRHIREGRLLCPSCWARVPAHLKTLFRTRLREGRAGGWEDHQIHNYEDVKRAVLEAALGEPVDAHTEERT